MKKLLLGMMAFVLSMPLMSFDVKAVENELRYSKYDRWHYRYETENGTYSFGETHPTSVELPEKYDSRDYGYVTSMKNQGSSGMCWAFGTIGAMEININKNGLNKSGDALDLSEAHLGYFHNAQKPNEMQLNPEDAVIPVDDYMFIDGGDSALLASLSLAKGIGPVSENVAPFYPYSYSFVNLIPRDSIYQREYYLNNASHPMIDDIEGVKKLIYTQGSATIAYNASSSDSYDHYVNRYGMSNHIIHIVGYDDTIPKERFDPVARIDGAWIVKNSWGETSNGGYFYLSYDASSLEVMAPNMVDKDAYDYNYFYEASFLNDRKYSYAGEPVTLANVYEGQNASDTQNEVLHSVGIFLAGMNTEYELQIYLDPEEGNPESGKAVFDKPITGNKVQRGYYTISLPESVKIKKGQKFSVVFRLQNRNLNYSTPYYVFRGGVSSLYTVVEQTMPNQSFVKQESENWQDLHNTNQCVAIHALTNMKDKDYKATKQLNINDFSISQTEYDYTNDAIEPILTKNNNELLEMIDYSVTYENNIELGTGKVIVFGMNDYEGSKVEYTFNIHKASLKQQYLEPIDFQYQTDSQIRPTIQMYDYDLLLEEGKDYIVEYGDNIYDTNADNEGKVTLKGIGNYEGTVTGYFDIVNPRKKVNFSVDVYPRDAGNASTKSEAHYGEEVKAVAGYYSSGTAMIKWLVNGIDFGRGEEVYFTAYDSMNLLAYFVNEVSFNDLLDLYNRLWQVQKGSANDVRWQTFKDELKIAEDLIYVSSDDSKAITRAYVYLQDAYNMLNEPLDLTAALQALDSIKNLNETDFDYRTWGTLQYRRVLLEKAIEDVNMTQDKLNTTVAEFNSAKQALTGNVSTIRQTLLQLYETKLLLNEDTYTVSSYYVLKEKLDEVKALLDNPNASESDMSKAYTELSQITLVERGNANTLISLINECLLFEENNYTKESFSSLQQTLQLALLIKNNPNDYSQRDIDTMYNQLKDVKDRLEPLYTSNKSLLIQLYNDNSNKNKDDYTSDTWNNFKQAYDYAYSIINNENISQEDVDNAYEQLDNAIRQLKNKEKPVNKDSLALAIANAKSLDLSTKTNESIVAFNNVLKQAQDLYDNNAATQQAVDQMIIELEEAIQLLEDKPIMNFPDVEEGSWYYPYVQSAFDKGLMSGMGDGTYFAPSHTLSRAMAVTILYRMSGTPDIDYTSRFSDVKVNDWHNKAVLWAASVGVVNGYSGSKQGMFGPNDSIKRQDLAVMMRNYAKKLGLDTNTNADFSDFEDGKNVDSYAKDALAWCIENKIISGSEVGNKRYLNAKKNTNRAEAAKMFSILDDLIKEKQE